MNTRTIPETLLVSALFSNQHILSILNVFYSGFRKEGSLNYFRQYNHYEITTKPFKIINTEYMNKLHWWWFSFCKITHCKWNKNDALLFIEHYVLSQRMEGNKGRWGLLFVMVQSSVVLLDFIDQLLNDAGICHCGCISQLISFIIDNLS